jgi:hypothetical protein
MEISMHANPKPPQQQETEWHGELQRFSGPALAPDDPNLEPRVRQGRPKAAPTQASKNDTAKESS